MWTFSVTASTAWLRVDVTRTLASWRTLESMMWKIVVLLPVPKRAERQGEGGKGGDNAFGTAPSCFVTLSTLLQTSVPLSECVDGVVHNPPEN